MKTLFAGARARPALSAEHTQKLAAVLGELSLQPAGDPWESCRWLCRSVDVVLDGHGSAVGFAVKSAAPPEQSRLFGWRPGFFLFAKNAEQRAQMHIDILRGREFLLDEMLRIKMQHAGRARVCASRSFDDESPAPLGLDGEIFRRLALVDRATLFVPLGPSLEGTVVVDRAKGPVLSREDAAWLLALVPAIEAPLRALARACGYIDAVEPFTPRERDVVQQLLTGASEKKIAASLSMSTGALHQRVKSIYRKLDVTSRAEMMALWLAPRTNKNRSKLRSRGR